MPLLNDNPFAILTAVVAPAILTNASSILCLGTGNRIARVVDRTRIVTAALASIEPGNPGYQAHVNQLQKLQVRAKLLLAALRLFYASLGSFAASALISVIGSVLAFYNVPAAFYMAAVAGLVIGALGVTGLVVGCTIMVRETRFAMQTLSEEAGLRHIR
jgi:hypothetical protein